MDQDERQHQFPAAEGEMRAHKFSEADHRSSGCGCVLACIVFAISPFLLTFLFLACSFLLRCPADNFATGPVLSEEGSVCHFLNGWGYAVHWLAIGTLPLGVGAAILSAVIVLALAISRSR